ncbi:SNAP receptor [Martiniozyma asiatica (nom. inval.)]|nr:SNAP receptor [Martiniozyma asiatica]
MSFANLNTPGKTQREAPGQPASVTSLDEASGSLVELSNLTSKLIRCVPVLGTKRDTPKLRAQCSTAISEAARLENRLEVALNGAADVSNDRERFVFGKLKEQRQSVVGNWKRALNEYNELINSVIVKENYARLQQEAVLAETISGRYTESTPLISTQRQDEVQGQGQGQLQLQLQLQREADPELSSAALQYHADLIEHRNVAINDIAQGVQDINKIFKDLDTIVLQQGEQLSTIEEGMINFANNNQLAAGELVKADEYQRRKGRWSCIILVVLLVVFLIILALVS